MVDKILQKFQLNPYNQYVVDCNTVNTLPKIIFFIDDKKYELEGNDYVLTVT